MKTPHLMICSTDLTSTILPGRTGDYGAVVRNARKALVGYQQLAERDSEKRFWQRAITCRLRLSRYLYRLGETMESRSQLDQALVLTRDKLGEVHHLTA